MSLDFPCISSHAVCAYPSDPGVVWDPKANQVLVNVCGNCAERKLRRELN